MTVLGLVWLVLAAGAVLGDYPRFFDGSGGGVSGAAPSAMVIVGVLAAVGVAHLWSSVSDSRAADATSRSLAVLGLLFGLGLIPGLPPVGILLTVGYGPVVLGMVRGNRSTESEELHDGLYGAPPPEPERLSGPTSKAERTVNGVDPGMDGR